MVETCKRTENKDSQMTIDRAQYVIHKKNKILRKNYITFKNRNAAVN